MTSSVTTGIIVPLYSYPGAGWATLVEAKTAHPHLPMIAIINPSSGPGLSRDSKYADGIKNLQGAGIAVLGYISTAYSARPEASIIADTDAYERMYPVEGIFFDEMSNVPGRAADYSALVEHARSIGFSLTVGNPGASISPLLTSGMDCLVVYENAGLPSIPTLTSRTDGLSRGQSAFISYSTTLPGASYLSSASQRVAYVYATDRSMPNPYSMLPSYLMALLDALERA